MMGVDRGDELARVVAAHEFELMGIEGVNGVGCGVRDGKLSIVVMTAYESPEQASKLPAVIEGFPVVVEAIGDVVAY